MAEAAAEKSKCRTQQFAASGEDDVKHVTQRAVVAVLERLEYIFDEREVLLDGAVKSLRPHGRSPAGWGTRSSAKRRAALTEVI